MSHLTRKLKNRKGFVQCKITTSVKIVFQYRFFHRCQEFFQCPFKYMSLNFCILHSPKSDKSASAFLELRGPLYEPRYEN